MAMTAMNITKREWKEWLLTCILTRLLSHSEIFPQVRSWQPLQHLPQQLHGREQDLHQRVCVIRSQKPDSRHSRLVLIKDTQTSSVSLLHQVSEDLIWMSHVAHLHIYTHLQRQLMSSQAYDNVVSWILVFHFRILLWSTQSIRFHHIHHVKRFHQHLNSSSKTWLWVSYFFAIEISIFEALK